MEGFDLSRNTASCDTKFIQYKNYKKKQSHYFPSMLTLSTWPCG